MADVGLRVPRDVSVISRDQFFPADFMAPRLTSVDQHNARFGCFVVQTLLSTVNGKEETVPAHCDPERIVRDSCIPPAPAAK